MYAEVQEEKERIASQASRQRTELDRLQRQLEDSHSGATDVMRKEYEKAREEQERRHAVSSSQGLFGGGLNRYTWLNVSHMFCIYMAK